MTVAQRLEPAVMLRSTDGRVVPVARKAKKEAVDVVSDVNNEQEKDDPESSELEEDIVEG